MRKNRWIPCPQAIPHAQKAQANNCSNQPPFISYREDASAQNTIGPFCAENMVAAKANIANLTSNPTLYTSRLRFNGNNCSATSSPITERCPAAGQNGNYGYSTLSVPQWKQVCIQRYPWNEQNYPQR